MRMPARTDLDMINSGQWVKAARKDYRHASGARVVYRNNDYVWEIIGGAQDGMRYGPLWVARYEVERAAAS